MYSSAFAKFRLSALGIALLGSATHAVSDAVVDAITSGKSFGDFRLRYENVAQDNTLKDALAIPPEPIRISAPRQSLKM